MCAAEVTSPALLSPLATALPRPLQKKPTTLSAPHLFNPRQRRLPATLSLLILLAYSSMQQPISSISINSHQHCNTHPHLIFTKKKKNRRTVPACFCQSSQIPVHSTHHNGKAREITHSLFARNFKVKVSFDSSSPINFNLYLLKGTSSIFSVKLYHIPFNSNSNQHKHSRLSFREKGQLPVQTSPRERRTPTAGTEKEGGELSSSRLHQNSSNCGQTPEQGQTAEATSDIE
ncbi:uncharacterized protein LOC131018086 [Salvia miltiorrhiza]|uniref:uncharacterized protein LOC131018086 n=1 Tax=Salvia miltiorrhiza TaxID=226208 RepID=UPI0025AD2D04|nr:uncharacterized protein LOC131018086 [Salvia miltiorrhiza]